MRDRDQLVLLGVGAGLLALLGLRGRGDGGAVSGGTSSGPAIDPTLLALTAGWRYPVEPLDVRRFPEFADGAARYRFPTISDPWRWRDNGKHHDGVDLMFKRRQWERVKLPDRSEWHDMPDGIHALSPALGKVSVSRDAENGGLVKIWHPGNLATQYLHLSKRLVAPGDVVQPGQRIGVIGYDPSGYKLRHLHFELLRDGKTPIDPEPLMGSWTQTLPPETVT